MLVPQAAQPYAVQPLERVLAALWGTRDATSLQASSSMNAVPGSATMAIEVLKRIVYIGV